jgi:hypothetical protein
MPGRIGKAIAALLMMPFFVRIFNYKNLFNGKRIAIVGAADSVMIEANGAYIDTFDFVIRINKSIITRTDLLRPFVGTKSNILFHSFYENTDRGGGGPLDFALFDKSEVQYIVQPRNNLEGWRVVFNFYKKYLIKRKVFVFSNLNYNKLYKLFKPLKPTIGFCAIYAALSSPCNEVFITGFTFFKTPYSQGYRDHLLDMNANEKHIKEQGQHSPDLEFELFKAAIHDSPVAKIIVDKKLYEILKSEDFQYLSSVTSR